MILTVTFTAQEDGTLVMSINGDETIFPDWDQQSLDGEMGRIEIGQSIKLALKSARIKYAKEVYSK